MDWSCVHFAGAAAIPAGAANPDLGRAFLRELKTRAAQAAMKEAGIEPLKGP